MAIQTTKSQLKKLKVLAEGGEAIIYVFNQNSVLKIFKDQSTLSAKEQKINAMLGKKAQNGLAVLPEDIVTINGKFVGYQMPIIPDGEPLHNFTKARFVKDHSLTNLDALQIITQLSKAIDDVHNAGFVIGDVSDNNFLASLKSGHPISLIDTDSWGINGLAPDAYTETFTPSEAYNGNSAIKLNEKTDNFGFSVLAFNVMTRIHPFGGNYQKSPNMNTVERIKRKLSLLGQHNIVYNDRLFNWSWMSPDLIDVLKNTFENGRRKSISGELDDQLRHSKHCKLHNVYYYDRYADCPLCAGVQKLKKVQPVIVPTGQGPQVVLIFSEPNIRFMLSKDTYVDIDDNFVYIPTKRTFKRQSRSKIYFASNGRYVISFLPSNFLVYDANDEQVANIDTMFHSSHAVCGANVLYTDAGGQVHRMLLSGAGLQDEVLFQSSNPLLSLNELGEYFVVNQYRNQIMISYKGHDVEIKGVSTIKEYAIKFDSISKTWLLIYEESSGAFRSMIFGQNGKEYDDNIVRYSATPLSNICYYNGTVYDPGIDSFTGTNLKKGTSKIFQCDKVDETSMLQFENNGFIIVGDTTIHRFG